ncbi:MAG: helix-turn-helix domain-containing protein [Pseudonocardiaceae bacterium]
MRTNVMLRDGNHFDPVEPISVKDLPDSEIYTARGVASMLSINVGTMYQLLRNGVIPAKRLGRRWVIPRKRFHEWLDGLEQEEV